MEESSTISDTPKVDHRLLFLNLDVSRTSHLPASLASFQWLTCIAQPNGDAVV